MSESIGAQLRRKRLEKMISLEAASRAVHIRIGYLQALEEDRRDQLPSSVQGKGFLRLYAGYLGLPIQPLIDQWEGRLPSPPEKSEPPVVPAASLPNGTQVPPVSPSAEPPSESPFEPAAEPPAEPTAKAAPVSASGTQVQLHFTEIGQLLAERREVLNLSLDEVERFTHVRRHYLTALEDGRLEDLPSPVQARGMLNNYARFLDLDADQLLNRFAEGLQARRTATQKTSPASLRSAKNKAAARQAPNGSRVTRLITPDLVIVGTVIIGLFLFAIWSAAQVSSRQREQVEVTPPSIAEVLLSSSPQAEIITRTPTAPANLGTRQPQTPVSTSDGAQPAITGSVPVTGAGALQITVAAVQRTYLRVTADNRISFDERLVPGNVYTFAANRTLEVLIGNAAGVKIYYNQMDLGNLGVVGEVKRILFTSEGVITPTPAFSPTPTRTLVPTGTLRPSPTVPTATITPFIP